MIQLGDNKYTIPPESYTFTQATSISTSVCRIGISYIDSSNGIYILGDTFLRNFVTSFDYAKGEIRLTQNINAPTGISVVRDADDDPKLGDLAIVFIIAGGFIILILLMVLTIRCCRSKKKNKGKHPYAAVAASD